VTAARETELAGAQRKATSKDKPSGERRAAAVRAITLAGLPVFHEGAGKAAKKVHDPANRAALALVLLETVPPDMPAAEKMQAYENALRMLKTAAAAGGGP